MVLCETREALLFEKQAKVTALPCLDLVFDVLRSFLSWRWVGRGTSHLIHGKAPFTFRTYWRRVRAMYVRTSTAVEEIANTRGCSSFE